MNLLIVDDEIVTTEVLQEQLDRDYMGIDNIYTAYNVSMAIEILEVHKVEIILCDVEMPKENGHKLLEWVRTNCPNTEFLFLSSHEKFEYIFDAVQKGAANYLLKPIDIPQINQALFAVAEKIRNKEHMQEIKRYWEYGKRKVVKNFWERLLQGKVRCNSEDIAEEVERLGIAEEIKDRYSLIVLHVNREVLVSLEEEKILTQFVLGNILAETFTLEFQMENVISDENEGEDYIFVISDILMEEITKKWQEINPFLIRYYKGAIAVAYFSEKSKITDLYGIKDRILQYDITHIQEDGKLLRFLNIEEIDKKIEKVLDEKFIFRCIERGDRVKLLEYLQKVVTSIKRTDSRVISFRCYQMELMQIVGVYLYQHNMELEFIYTDPIYIRIQSKSTSSEYGMIQWNVYYMNQVFDGAKRLESSKSVVDVMVDYIRKHYEEDVTRTTLAEIVHLTPEYTGKIFKKEVNMSINDYIHQVRIEKAKKMLLDTNYKIIDIALMIGYDNMSYFSSVFKKTTGFSPAEYRKNCSGENRI